MTDENMAALLSRQEVEPDMHKLAKQAFEAARALDQQAWRYR